MKTNEIQFVENIPSISVAERKKRLRAYMKQRRGENENRDVKEHLAVELFKSTFLEGQKKNNHLKYFVYLSFSSEMPTDKLIELLLSERKKVYCPRIEKGEMKAVEYGEDFTLSNYGIREPIGEAYEGEIDVLIMPLLAVDEKGNRLGYGGGYYDRFLKLHKKAKRIAYCYDFQILNSVPCEALDEKVQSIVTDKRVVFCEK